MCVSLFVSYMALVCHTGTGCSSTRCRQHNAVWTIITQGHKERIMRRRSYRSQEVKGQFAGSLSSVILIYCYFSHCTSAMLSATSHHDIDSDYDIEPLYVMSEDSRTVTFLASFCECCRLANHILVLQYSSISLYLHM